MIEPRPVALMTPMSMQTKAMNGRMVRTTWSMARLPLWNSTLTTPPMARPMLAMKPVKPPSIPEAGAAGLVTNGVAGAAATAGAALLSAADASPSTGIRFSGLTPET